MFKKDFNLMITGQLISVITGSTLSFILGLYILTSTKSAFLFSLATALSAIPWAIFAPLGGVVADKYNQKNIIVILDFITGVLIFFLCFLPINFTTICVMKIIFSCVQALYYPSVVSSLPFLVKSHDLIKANSLTSSINSISRIISPMVAGVLYSIIDIKLLLIGCGVLFIFSAIIEIFINIDKESVLVLENDTSLADAFNFMKNSGILKIVLNSSFIVSVIAGICVVALPFIINITLSLSSSYYGFINGIVGFGSLFAGFLVFKYNHLFSIERLSILYNISTLCILLFGMSLWLFDTILIFVLICILAFIMNTANAIAYILRNGYIQKLTPSNLIGKVMSLTSIISGIFEPVIQIIFGVTLGIFSANWILIISAVSLIPFLFQTKNIAKI